MTAQEFQALLIEGGIDQETVAKLTGNANITTKLGQLKQAAEYQSIQQRADALLAEKQALESELIGTDAKPGSRKYQQWYSENYATITANATKLKETETQIKALEDSVKEYETKYGKVNANTPPPAPPLAIPGLTQDDVKKIALEIAKAEATSSVTEAYKNTYAPQVVTTMTGIGTIVEMNVERNLQRGKKTRIDWKKLDELAAKPEIAGDVVKAYEEWDAPNVLADQEVAKVAHQAAEDKRVEERVNELLKKKMLQQNFPAGAEGASSSVGTGAPSPLGRESADPKRVYDRSKLVDAYQSVQ